MSKKRWLIVPLCVVLCSQGLSAQTLDRKVLGINEMFRLADENSQSIQTYKTGKEAADEALKAARAQRLPDIGANALNVRCNFLPKYRPSVLFYHILFCITILFH